MKKKVTHLEIKEKLSELPGWSFSNDQLKKSYLENTEKGEYKFQSGILYNDIFSSCEKVGDHIINVSEAIAGEV